MSSRRAGLAAALTFLSLLGVAEARADPVACEGATAPIAEREGVALPRTDGAAFARANAARVMLERPELDPTPHVEAALAAAEALPPGRDRILLELHVARTLIQWTELERERGAETEVSDAKRLQAAQVLSHAADLARSTGEQRMLSHAEGHRAELYETAGRLREASILADSAALAAAAVDAPDLQGRWQGLRGRLLQRQGNSALAIAAYRHARIALSGARARMEAGAFLELARPIYLDLVDLLLEESDRDPTHGPRLLREAQRALEDLKVAELRDYFHDECLAVQERRTLESIPGAVVLYPILLPQRVELLVSRGGSLSRVTAPATTADVTETARRLRRLLQDPTTRRYREPARQLYDWLLRPIEEFWADAGATLVFVPSDVLFDIPLAALLDSRSGRFLVEKIPIAVTPSLELTDPRPIDRGHAALLAAGLSKAVAGFPALPSVGAEIEAVTASFPGVRIVDEAFSSTGLEEALSARPFGIVHVASHGEFSADSGESFVLAHDGRISMDELARIVGRTRFRAARPLELLTLSACSTAEGDERAALGLAGVAVQAGARSALAALWRIQDQAAAELVGEFYRQLAAGASRAQALQRAQQKLIASEPFRHPSNWAAFLLVNSWL